MILRPVRSIFLRICEIFYWLGLQVHSNLYKIGFVRSKKFNPRVISIGNITWGGTGKTPLTIMLAHHLSSLGKRVVVLTRGYGEDEQYELKDRLKNVPILIGKNRSKNAAIATKEHNADCILVDDGYQHWAMKRDYDVVALNSTNPFGNGKLIPRGILREPIKNLKRANCFVLTQAFLGRHNAPWIRQKLSEVNPNASIFEADHRPRRFVDFRRDRSSLPLDLVRGQNVAVLSGIEDPMSFENAVSRLGANILYAARFNDHHVFKKNELDRVFKECKNNNVRYLITTAKDSYRLKRILNPKLRQPVRILVLQIELRMDDEERFIEKCLDQSIVTN